MKPTLLNPHPAVSPFIRQANGRRARALSTLIVVWLSRAFLHGWLAGGLAGGWQIAVLLSNILRVHLCVRAWRLGDRANSGRTAVEYSAPSSVGSAVRRATFAVWRPQRNALLGTRRHELSVLRRHKLLLPRGRGGCLTDADDDGGAFNFAVHVLYTLPGRHYLRCAVCCETFQVERARHGLFFIRPVCAAVVAVRFPQLFLITHAHKHPGKWVEWVYRVSWCFFLEDMSARLAVTTEHILHSSKSLEKNYDNKTLFITIGFILQHSSI